MRPDREVDLHWTPLSNNRYQKEHEALTKMVISDAAEIKSWSESELISVMANTFQPESIKLANQILNANSNIINSSNFEELIFSGRVIHTSLFSFLKSKFEDKTSITKEQFIDE